MIPGSFAVGPRQLPFREFNRLKTKANRETPRVGSMTPLLETLSRSRQFPGSLWVRQPTPQRKAGLGSIPPAPDFRAVFVDFVGPDS